jgi:hypothetical protein
MTEANGDNQVRQNHRLGFDGQALETSHIWHPDWRRSGPFCSCHG